MSDYERICKELKRLYAKKSDIMTNYNISMKAIEEKIKNLEAKKSAYREEDKL